MKHIIEIVTPDTGVLDRDGNEMHVWVTEVGQSPKNRPDMIPGASGMYAIDKAIVFTAAEVEAFLAEHPPVERWVVWQEATVSEAGNTVYERVPQ